MLNFYHRFIPICAWVLSPVNTLLKKPKKGRIASVYWNREAETAFKKVKDCLASVVLLAYPIPNAETSLCVDTSDDAVGAALQQNTGMGWKP